MANGLFLKFFHPAIFRNQCQVSRSSLIRLAKFNPRNSFRSASTTSKATPPNSSEGPQLLYYRKANRIWMWGPLIIAGTQVIFWGNLASLAASNTYEQNEETGEWNLAPRSKRFQKAFYLIVVGAVFVTIILWLPSRIVSRIMYVPQINGIVVSTPDMWMPFRKIRLMAAPLQKWVLNGPLYTGLGKYGSSAGATQFRFVRMRLERQKAGYVIDRDGIFVGGAKRFENIFSQKKAPVQKPSSK